MGETLTREEVERIVNFVRHSWAGVEFREEKTAAMADALGRHDEAQRRALDGQADALNVARGEAAKLRDLLRRVCGTRFYIEALADYRDVRGELSPRLCAEVDAAVEGDSK